MVPDASRFGTIHINEQNEIIRFTEKGGTIDNGFINAGIYMMESSAFNKILTVIADFNETITATPPTTSAKNGTEYSILLSSNYKKFSKKISLIL